MPEPGADRPLAEAWEPELPERLEEAEEVPPVAAEDPVSRYFREIGKAKLLTAAQEVELARRIEAGQVELRRALAAIPSAVEAIRTLVRNVRQGALPLDELIAFPGGDQVPRGKVRSVRNARATRPNANA